MSDKQFIDGVQVYLPSTNAPEFIKMQVYITDAFIAYYQANKTEKGLRMDIKASRKLDDYGRPKLYAELNNFVPKSPIAKEKPTETVDDVAKHMESVNEVRYPDEDINPENIPF